ncbi:chaplin [Streptomyces sp. enrichment culture]|uniref:chaplin n=1 Tax=Streptomyces sp. enrichment culture TaxID=1795815 RepID=UPI003F5599DE
MTAEKGKLMKRSAAVVTGAVTAPGGCAVPAVADAGAEGAVTGSRGVPAGGAVQVPAHVSIDVRGNTVSGVGAPDPAYGGKCGNG